MMATIHAALSVGHRLTSDKVIDHLALVPPWTTWFLAIDFLGSFVACALLSTEVISKERGTSLNVEALIFVQAATLVLMDTLGAAKQEALVTGTGLHTAFVALCGSIWVFTGGRARNPAGFIMAVLWTCG